MKKNVMMRVASIMLVLVLMTSSVISGTFAKYVTSGESSDTARVAAFGVQVSADFSDLFKYEYKTDNSWTGDTDSLSVVSVYGGDVVAPGTDGTLADFTVTGKPEVDVAVTYEVDLKLENWKIGEKEYCPIEIFIGNNAYWIDIDENGKSDGTAATVAELEAQVEELIEECAANYNAGTDLAEVVADDLLYVGWRWSYEGSEKYGVDSYQTDAKDTALGNWILNGAEAPSITLEITCTVTQID